MFDIIINQFFTFNPKVFQLIFQYLLTLKIFFFIQQHQVLIFALFMDFFKLIHGFYQWFLELLGLTYKLMLRNYRRILKRWRRALYSWQNLNIWIMLLLKLSQMLISLVIKLLRSRWLFLIFYHKILVFTLKTLLFFNLMLNILIIFCEFFYLT